MQLHPDNLNELCENATTLHNMLLPLLPEDEQTKQEEWYSSIMKYSDTFKENMNSWMSETVESLHNDSPDQSGQVVTTLLCISDIYNSQTAVQAVSIIMADDLQDEVKPSDSVSNVGRGARSQSSVVGGKSAVSTTSSVRLQAEADLAALMARQKILKDRHELEQLRKRKERLKLDEEIAAQMAKLDVLRTRSILSRRGSRAKHSDGLNSYLKEQKLTSQPLRADAKAFVPQMSAKPKENSEAPQPHSHSLHAPSLQAGQNTNESMQIQQQDALGGNTGSGNVDQNNMLAIMGRQNEITSLLIQQQSHPCLGGRSQFSMVIH